MIAILGAIFGFLAPLIPEVIKLWTRAGDRKHEIELRRLDMEADKQHWIYQREAMEVQGDIEEAKMLHKEPEGFSARLVKAATSSKWPMWAIVPGYWLMTLVDVLTQLVRPTITYAVVAFYAYVKLAHLKLMGLVITDPATYLRAVYGSFGETDYAVLMTVIGFWFGHRTARYAFNWTTRADNPLYVR